MSKFTLLDHIIEGFFSYVVLLNEIQEAEKLEALIEQFGVMNAGERWGPFRRYDGGQSIG